MCDGTVVDKNVTVHLKGRKITRVPAGVCQKCGERYFDAETTRVLTESAKNN